MGRENDTTFVKNIATSLAINHPVENEVVSPDKTKHLHELTTFVKNHPSADISRHSTSLELDENELPREMNALRDQ